MQVILVYGRYQTTIAAIEGPQQWGHSSPARLTGIMDWDLEKYMWSQVAGFAGGPVELSFGAVAETQCHVECVECPPDLLSQNVVLRVYVRETPELGGDLLPFADTPVLTLAQLLAPPPATWAWIAYPGAGRSMLDYALHERASKVQLVCEIEFQSLAQGDLPASYMTVDLDMPWKAEMTP
jgi:hypothetical protein